MLQQFILKPDKNEKAKIKNSNLAFLDMKSKGFLIAP